MKRLSAQAQLTQKSHDISVLFFAASPGQATTGTSTFGSSSGSLFGAAGSSSNAAATSTSSSTG